MKPIHIVSIIILMGGVACLDTNINIPNEQKILLRKLQNFEEPKNETKPLTWNEILADVLVNRIRIFSFRKANESDIVDNKENSTISKPKKILLTGIGEALILYKSCIYDKWIQKYHEEPGYVPETVTTESIDAVIDADTVPAPNDDVEIIEPKYHGKLEDGKEDEVTIKAECAEGSVKDQEGNCVNIHSRLLISVPNQCPPGYRADRLGNCRLLFF